MVIEPTRGKFFRYLTPILVAALLAACSDAGLFATPTREPETLPSTIAALDSDTGLERWRIESPVNAVTAMREVSGMLLLFGYDACPWDKAELVALHAADGRFAWSTEVQGYSCDEFEELAVHGEIVVACIGEAYVGLDVRTGTERWRNPSVCGGIRHVLPLGDVALGVGWGDAIAIDATTGQTLWTSDRISDERAVAETGDVAFHLTDESRMLVALDRRTGAELWTHRPVTGDYEPSIAAGEGVVVLIEPQDTTTKMIALEAASGAQRWQIEQDHWVRQPTIAHARAYIAIEDAGDYVVRAFDLATGERDIRFESPTFGARWNIEPQTAGVVIGGGGFVLRQPLVNQQGDSWLFKEQTEAVAATDTLIFVALHGKPGVVDR
jgi:outer membrane protein assembly factor BamB